MAADLRFCSIRVISKKEPARHGIPGVATNLGIADKTGKTSPWRQFEFSLSTVENSLAKCDREANGRVVNLVVVGIVADETTEVVRIELELSCESLGESHLIIVSFLRLHREAQEVA